MPATNALYQQTQAAIKRYAGDVRAVSRTRLSLLVVGLIQAQSSALRRIAAAVEVLGLTEATRVESIARRLRRTLSDPHLEAARCYAPAVRAIVDWSEVVRHDQPLVLIVDESSHTDQVHLLRLSLAYRGGALPLAWRVWRQNVALAAGQYWQAVEAVLAEAASLLQGVLPPTAPVVVVADRAYDVPGFTDRVAAQGWDWVVRAKANSSLRYRDATGAEQVLGTLVRQQIQTPGQTWETTGWVFKDAGWRAARIVAGWEAGTAEVQVLLTSAPAALPVAACYDRRFWTEPGFRQDKSSGWDWEASQVRDLARQARLLLGMAWASLVMLCLGSEAAEAQVAHARARPGHGQPPRQFEHARESLFRLGLHQAHKLLAGTRRAPIRWCLPALTAPSWTQQYETVQLHRYLPAVPP